MKYSYPTALETTMLPVLLLQNKMLHLQTNLLYKRQFFTNLKYLNSQDAIVGTQIAPLSRNECPNNSSLNAKLGFTSQSFNSLIRNFELMTKNCHVCGSTLYKEYRARVNELEKYMVMFENEKRKIEERERQLVDKIKTLRFKTVPVAEGGTQTETSVDGLVRREIIGIRNDQERRDLVESQVREHENKENYLRYMEEIINQRQGDLDRREAELNQLERGLNAQDTRFKTEPLNHLVDSKRMYQYFSILKDRIYDAVLKYQSGQPSILKLLQNHPLYDLYQRYQQHNINPRLKFQILKLLQINTLQQRYKLQVCEDYFYAQSHKIEQLKKELEEKNIKFMELTSYEHFLDRYRLLLDQREDDLGERIGLFKEETKVVMEYLDIKSFPGDSADVSSSFSFLQQIEREMKGNSSGRGRIFTLRQRTNNIIEEYKTIKPEMEKQFLSEKINKMKEGYESQLCQLKRISDLEQEVERLKSELSNNQTSLTNRNREWNKENKPYEMNNKYALVSQHPDKNFLEVLEEAARKKKVINALSKMFRFSFFKNIKNVNLNKGLAWLVWRSKQYDLEAYDRIKELAAEEYQDHEEDMWRRKSIVLKKQKLFPYKSLSLNRKQFLEHFFDYERKQFFKDRLKALLLSITRNKIRKERMIYIVYFHRFVRNSMLTNIPKLKLERLSQRPPISKNMHEKTSSRALKPANNQTNSRTTLSFDSNNTKRSSKIREQSSTKQCPTDKNSERTQHQRRFRKMLSCAKLSHLLKDLHSRQSQHMTKSFHHLKQNYLNYKILRIQSLVDQISFDNNIFATKFNICQSSFTSKMSLLEEFLAIAPK